MEDEAQGYRDWTLRALEAASESRVSPRLPSGFSRFDLPDSPIMVVSESGDSLRGAGALALREGAAAPVVVEAPHTFYDRGTLEIAVALFAALEARALLINTVHRYRGNGLASMGGPRGSASDPVADVAHTPRSFFAAAHEATARARPALLAVQVHGYRDQRVPGFDAVLSAAGSSLDPEHFAHCMEHYLTGARVGVYPRDLRDLGGTRNRQAQSSVQFGAPFLHVELSARLRARLRQPGPGQSAFAAAFFSVSEGSCRP
ncbi:MAG: hypothetical protein OEZ06_16350 [Myxococcales bacterium]|nr:hypothetical protein [Myxococcales bacterium]